MAGFAIFAMFFGSGNLVFPLITGYTTGSLWGEGVLGFSITGVLIPALGLFVTTLCDGKVNEVFRPLTKTGAIGLSLFLLAILGPLGVVPRCIMVAYGSFQTFGPGFPLWIFSAFWCLVLYMIMPNRDKVVPMIGRYLTPVKLGTLLLVVGGAMWAIPEGEKFLSCGEEDPLMTGVFQGYHTMDLIASFFFAMSVMGYFKSVDSNNMTYVWKKSLLANLVGIIILFAMYVSFVYLGAAYQPLLKNVAAEQMLPTIARYALGQSSGYVVSLTIIVSCLTTSVALIGAFCDYISDLLNLTPRGYLHLLRVAIGATFAVSLLGFQQIGAFLGPILEILYPFILVLTGVKLVLRVRALRKEGALS